MIQLCFALPTLPTVWNRAWGCALAVCCWSLCNFSNGVWGQSDDSSKAIEFSELPQTRETVATDLARFYGVEPRPTPTLSSQTTVPARLPESMPAVFSPLPGLTSPTAPRAPESRVASETVLPVLERIPHLAAAESGWSVATASGQTASNTWWHSAVVQPICGLPQSEALDIGALIQLTLRGSRHLQAISQEPLIRELDEAAARAAFDPVLFAKTLYDDRTDPVGNTLTTGGLPFLKDNIWTGQAGIRRKFFTGGSLETSQLFGFQNSNSRFFVPQDQGTATLAVNLQQPLLRGSGQCYNRAQILLAQANAGASWDQVSAKVQDELTRAVIAYWNLYAARSIYLQKLRNFEGGQAVLTKLEARAEYDAQALQIAQARASVASRKMELANALRDVRNAETEIRRIIGDTQLADADQVEMLTMESPIETPEVLDLSQVVPIALANRPELRQVMKKLKAAAIKSDVARNEMLPDLSLLFGTYVKGLEGNSGIGEAWKEQFTNSTPGYSAGLQYEFPWRNRSATARHRQNRLEYVRYQNELEQATIDIIADSQQSFRRLASGYETLEGAQAALAAAQIELEQIDARWNAFALVEGDWSEGQTQSFLLDQLLAGQQKLTAAEIAVTESEKEIKIAQITLRRAMGILMSFYQVGTETSCLDGIPQVDYHAGAIPTQPDVEPSSSAFRIDK